MQFHLLEIIRRTASKNSSKINFLWMLQFALAETQWCFLSDTLGLYQNVSLPNEVLLCYNVEHYKILYCKVYFCKTGKRAPVNLMNHLFNM